VSQNDACDSLGIKYATLRTWLSRGRKYLNKHNGKVGEYLPALLVQQIANVAADTQLPETVATDVTAEHQKRGRKKLNPMQYVNDLARSLSLGLTIEQACDAVGIGKTSYYAWLQKADADKTGDSVYSEFENALKSSLTLNQRALTEKAIEACSQPSVTIKKEYGFVEVKDADGNPTGEVEKVLFKETHLERSPSPTAMLYYLRQRFPDTFATTNRLEVNSKNQHEVNVSGQIGVDLSFDERVLAKLPEKRLELLLELHKELQQAEEAVKAELETSDAGGAVH